MQRRAASNSCTAIGGALTIAGVGVSEPPVSPVGRAGHAARAQAKPGPRAPRCGHQLTCPITYSLFCLTVRLRHLFIRNALFQELFPAVVSAYCRDSLKIWVFKSHESEKNEKKTRTVPQAHQVTTHWRYLEFFLTFNLVLSVCLFVFTNTGEMKGISKFHLRRTYFLCSAHVWEDVHDLTGGNAIPDAWSYNCIKETRRHYPAYAKTVAALFFTLLSKEKE